MPSYEKDLLIKEYFVSLCSPKNKVVIFKRRLYKRHNLSAPRGYFRMVRPLIKELITEEMLEMIQLTQGLISSVIQKS